MEAVKLSLVKKKLDGTKLKKKQLKKENFDYNLFATFSKN